ncbi:divalent cation tolerance protein CutA [Shigella flexneri]
MPGATSLYYWEGNWSKIRSADDFKTTVSHQQALLECLKSHHPYQTRNFWFCLLHTETPITSHG